MRPGSPTVHPSQEARVRLLTALDLWTTGVELQHQRFRRLHPDATEAEIAEMVGCWLRTRPGAELGDGPQRS